MGGRQERLPHTNKTHANTLRVNYESGRLGASIIVVSVLLKKYTSLLYTNRGQLVMELHILFYLIVNVLKGLHSICLTLTVYFWALLLHCLELPCVLLRKRTLGWSRHFPLDTTLTPHRCPFVSGRALSCDLGDRNRQW